MVQNHNNLLKFVSLVMYYYPIQKPCAPTLMWIDAINYTIFLDTKNKRSGQVIYVYVINTLKALTKTDVILTLKTTGLRGICGSHKAIPSIKVFIALG